MIAQYLSTVEALKQQFESLEENRGFLLEQAITDVEQGQWSPDYTQSIQPYYCEINDKKLKSHTLLASPKDCNEACVLVIENNAKPEYVVEFLGPKVQYESLYFYSDKAITRCQLYKNATQIKPITIEQLELDDQGSPLTFTEFRDGASRQIHYVTEGNRIVTKSYYLYEGKLVEHEAFDIHLADQQVSKIIDTKTGATVFSVEQSQASISELLENYQNTIFQLIIKGLKSNPPESQNIIGMILEFFPESPFPPSIGLTTQKDRNAAADDYPLGWLNAAELEDFYECEFFYEDRSDETLNAKLKALGFEETVRLSEIWYQTLCKRISNSKEIKGLVGANDDFFAIAHDYTSGTDPETLENYLTPEMLEAVKTDLFKLADSYQEKVNDNPFIIKANSFKKSVYERLAGIKSKHAATKFEQRYSTHNYYSINPFKWASKDNSRQFSIDQLALRPLPPETETYCVYDISDGRIHAITQYNKSVPIAREYILNGNEAYEQIIIDIGISTDYPDGELQGYTRVDHIDGQPQRCYTLNDYFLDVEEFHSNKAGQIVSIVRSSHYLESAANDSSTDMDISYTGTGELENITHHLPGDSSNTLYDNADRQLDSAQNDYASLLGEQLTRFIAGAEVASLSLRLIPQANQQLPFVIIADRDDATEYLKAHMPELDSSGQAIHQALQALSERYHHLNSITSSFIPRVANNLIDRATLLVFEKTGLWLKMELGRAHELRNNNDQPATTIN